MIEIDGSIGGGQVVRTAVSLSALTKKPVRISNIRKGRESKQPGLRPQHLMGIKIAGEFCQAHITGLKENSLEVEFIPKKLNVSNKEIDIGTAGSISLLLQTINPLLIFAKKPIDLEITGGTETKWSPTIQYVKYVTYPILKMLDAKLDLEIIKHGYYPKGGGRVSVKSKPINKLNHFISTNRGNIIGIHVDSVCGHLPPDIAERQGNSALRTIQYYYPNVKVSMSYKSVSSLSPGTSVTCYAVCEKSRIGSSSLGELGVRAETIGERAANSLINSLETSVALDRYTADQILIYLALAKGRSQVMVEEITQHVKTNIRIIEQILPVEFQVDYNKKLISVDGIGFKP